MEKSKMSNIYQKLAIARDLLRAKNIKPTGKNQGRFTYFELEDILPHITNICATIGILPVMNYYQDKAVLTIYDTESDQVLTLESPMSTAQLAGCHPVQNLGAAQTYLKRYLYMHAFDVAESDVLDGSIEPDEKPKRQNAKTPRPEPKPQAPAEPDRRKATPEQSKELSELAKNFTPEELAALKADYGHDVEMLIDKMKEYSQEKTQEKHKWASPETKQKLGIPVPDEFKDDSQDLYKENK